MMKMIICMDEDKIIAENKYRLEGIYTILHQLFDTVGFSHVDEGSGALVFWDCGRAKDFSLFGRIVNTLKRQDWFMENVSVWQLSEGEDGDCPEDVIEEDLLRRYREKS